MNLLARRVKSARQCGEFRLCWVTISGCDNLGMQDSERYRQILEVEAPWFVERVELKLARGEVHHLSGARRDGELVVPGMRSESPV
jgi:hypothetical protein